MGSASHTTNTGGTSGGLEVPHANIAILENQCGEHKLISP